MSQLSYSNIINSTESVNFTKEEAMVQQPSFGYIYCAMDSTALSLQINYDLKHGEIRKAKVKLQQLLNLVERERRDNNDNSHNCKQIKAVQEAFRNIIKFAPSVVLTKDKLNMASSDLAPPLTSCNFEMILHAVFVENLSFFGEENLVLTYIKYLLDNNIFSTITEPPRYNEVIKFPKLFLEDSIKNALSIFNKRMNADKTDFA